MWFGQKPQIYFCHFFFFFFFFLTKILSKCSRLLLQLNLVDQVIFGGFLKGSCHNFSEFACYYYLFIY